MQSFGTACTSTMLERGNNMSQKHFIELAKMVASMKGQMTEDNRKIVAERLAAVCASANACFRHARFMAACGF